MEKVIVIVNKKGSFLYMCMGVNWRRGLNYANQFKTLKEAREFVKANSLDATAKAIPLEAFVTQAIVDYCEYEGGDRYGQLGCMSISALWGKSAKRVKELYKGMFAINVYGWRYGSYEGIMGFSGILNDELREECIEAFAIRKR